MIARITMLEAGAEPDRGQQAVVEVILNWMYSDQFPDTVYEVLSQKDNGCSQFVTWKNRNMDVCETFGACETGNVKAVLDGGNTDSAFKTMYFSLEKENGHIQCVIGNHVFCNQT
ncbi:MAG: cell wall hydrolase [Acutalibacteraceae bacterium]